MPKPISEKRYQTESESEDWRHWPKRYGASVQSNVINQNVCLPGADDGEAR